MIDLLVVVFIHHVMVTNLWVTALNLFSSFHLCVFNTQLFNTMAVSTKGVFNITCITVINLLKILINLLLTVNNLSITVINLPIIVNDLLITVINLPITVINLQRKVIYLLIVMMNIMPIRLTKRYLRLYK